MTAIVLTNRAPAQLLLSPDELIQLAELRQLEAIVERHLQGFLEAGQALADIYQQEKFKLTHKTFVEYLHERWPSIGRAYAWRLISAASVVKDLTATSPVGDVAVLPTNEHQVRHLGGLPAAQRREVWAAGVAEAGGKPPSAARVAELAAKAREALGADRKLELQRQEEERLRRSAQDRRVLTHEQLKNKHLARAVFLLRQAIRHLVAADGESDHPEPLELMRQAYLLPPFAE